MGDPAAQMAGLKGILKWTLGQTGTSDGTTASSTSAEDRAWLMKAMDDMMVDQVDVLKECVDALKSGKTDDVLGNEDAMAELQERALDRLLDVVEDINYARDLGTIGGLEPLLGLLNSPLPQLRQKSANVLGTLVQNAPVCQQWALDRGALEKILEQCERETVPKVFVKLVFALASLCRGFAPALNVFIHKYEGLSKFSKWLSLPFPVKSGLVKKVVFLVHGILGEFPAILNCPRGVELMKTVAPYTGYVPFASSAALPPDASEQETSVLTLDDQTKDIAQQALLSFVSVPVSSMFTTALLQAYPSLVENIELRLQELQAVTGDEAEYVMYELERCTSLVRCITSNVPLFEPTKEWKPILPGQHIPGGLEIKVNMSTGEKFARLCAASE